MKNNISPKSALKFLAVFTVPIALLFSGLGLGVVVADQKSYQAPTGREAFDAAPRSLLRETRPTRQGPSRADRQKAAKLSKQCKRGKPAARKRCRAQVASLLKVRVARNMTEAVASRAALKNAERVYDNDFGAEAEGVEYWIEYGRATSRCRVLKSNSRVCAVFVAAVDEDPDSYDYKSSYECEWVVKSTNLANGKLEIVNSFARDRTCSWDWEY